MKKRNKIKQDKLHKITRKRALYEKARKLKIKSKRQLKQDEQTEKR